MALPVSGSISRVSADDISVRTQDYTDRFGTGIEAITSIDVGDEFYLTAAGFTRRDQCKEILAISEKLRAAAVDMLDRIEAEDIPTVTVAEAVNS